MFMKIFVQSALFVAVAGILTAGAPYILSADGNLETSGVVATMARSQLSAGDRFAARGAFGSAVEAYDVAAQLTRLQGDLPLDAMRRIANAQYYDEDYRGAAATLEQLADEAARIGDHMAEFWAITDATYMARLAGDEGYVLWYTKRAERLLESPELTAEERGELEKKLEESNLTVFAPHLSSW
jgi:hypothetical protein